VLSVAREAVCVASRVKVISDAVMRPVRFAPNGAAR
jgi:hypothetical protein